MNQPPDSTHEVTSVGILVSRHVEVAFALLTTQLFLFFQFFSHVSRHRPNRLFAIACYSGFRFQQFVDESCGYAGDSTPERFATRENLDLGL